MAKSKAKSKAKASATPGHYTDKGTRKFQANGPIEWSKVFTKAAGKEHPEGFGIRAAMAYAIAHEDKFLAWCKAQAESEAKPAAKPAAKAKAAGKVRKLAGKLGVVASTPEAK
jgi:hypothetical protein